MAQIKEKVVNTCLTCGAEAIAVKVAKTKTSRELKIESGMMWQCKNDHVNRVRHYEVIQVKVG